jgi:hypothetical protein
MILADKLKNIYEHYIKKLDSDNFGTLHDTMQQQCCYRWDICSTSSHDAYLIPTEVNVLFAMAGV